jgi:hypothetical protein
VLIKATAKVSRAEFGMTALTSLISDDVQLCMTVKAMQYQATKFQAANGNH